MQDTLGAMLVRCGERYSALTAVRSSNGDRTYAEALENGARLANALRAYGLAPGDRVLMMLENRAEVPS